MDLFAIGCPRCDAQTGLDPEEKFGADERFWCGECGHDLGSWTELHARFYAPVDQMLTAALARAPRP